MLGLQAGEVWLAMILTGFVPFEVKGMMIGALFS